MRSIRKLPALIAVAAFVAALLALVVPLTRTVGERDRYGRVAIPGKAVLAFEEGDLLVSYELPIKPGPSEVVIYPPSDLRLRIRSRRTGDELPLEYAANRTGFEEPRSAGTSVFAARVPRAGRYSVEVSRDDVVPKGATVTFGPDSPPGPSLRGAGVVLAAGLALAALTALLLRLLPRPRLTPAVPPPSSSAPVASWQQSPRHDPEQELRRLKADWERGRIDDREYERRRTEVLQRL